MFQVLKVKGRSRKAKRKKMMEKEQRMQTVDSASQHGAWCIAAQRPLPQSDKSDRK